LRCPNCWRRKAGQGWRRSVYIINSTGAVRVGGRFDVDRPESPDTLLGFGICLAVETAAHATSAMNTCDPLAREACICSTLNVHRPRVEQLWGPRAFILFYNICNTRVQMRFTFLSGNSLRGRLQKAVRARQIKLGAMFPLARSSHHHLQNQVEICRPSGGNAFKAPVIPTPAIITLSVCTTFMCRFQSLTSALTSC
jgi:hypothetical protein